MSKVSNKYGSCDNALIFVVKNCASGDPVFLWKKKRIRKKKHLVTVFSIKKKNVCM